MKTRKYEQKERARQRECTRLRIVEATVALHSEVGPRETTIKAVAERAGVERLTVYRHFPDQDALLGACTSHWLQLHPLPDWQAWRTIADSQVRISTALAAVYGYYRQTQRTWMLSWRDRRDVPALELRMAQVDQYLDDASVALLAQDARPEYRTTLRHALQFPVWQSLEDQSVHDNDKIRLVIGWLRGC